MFRGVLWYFIQVFKGLSRLLNALLGGEGDTTFSAYSGRLANDGRRPISRWYGRGRVWCIDGVFGHGHCQAAYEWHLAHNLFEIEKAEML
jgi:hypothetical protein